MRRPYLLLDRDGTLIEERKYLADPSGAVLLPGAAQAVKSAIGAGWGVAVISNQSGVARGLMSPEQVTAVNDRVRDLLAEEGAEVAEFCFCPHGASDGCKCRKPNTGMVLDLSRRAGVDLLRSVVVGDKESDIQLARNVGARAVLVRTGYGLETESQFPGLADEVIDELSGLAPLIHQWKDLEGPELFARRHLENSARTLLQVRDRCLPDLGSAAQTIAAALQDGRKLLICGNGGSAADSQHLAAEFVVRLSGTFERRAWPAIALTTDSSILTAFGNDYGFERVFARQVEALGSEGDVLLVISTSGESANVLRAAETARQRSLAVVGLLGGSGGSLKDLCDVPIVVPSDSTQHVQESHLALYHLLCGLVERMLYPWGE